MDDNFSDNLTEIFRHAREIAIELGYNYISTLHLYLADCKLRQSDSLYSFSFLTAEQFDKFFESARLGEKNEELEFESLPITVEAESAIKGAETERDLLKQSKMHCCHFFLASLKVKDSNFKDCFEEDESLLEKLFEYYKKLGAFEADKLSENEIKNQYYDSTAKSSFSIKNILRFLKHK